MKFDMKSVLVICSLLPLYMADIQTAKPIKWGIIGAGRIAQEFLSSVSLLPQENHTILAIASRIIGNARDLGTSFSVPNVYNNYKDLIANPEIQIIYIALVNTLRYNISKEALLGGKHVLCKAPVTTKEAETNELLTIAKDKNLFFMEALWSRFFPIYDEIKRILDSGELGVVKEVYTIFGDNIENDTVFMGSEVWGGGVITDLSTNSLYFQQFIFNNKTPTKIIAAEHIKGRGFIKSLHAVIVYPDNQAATLLVSKQLKLPYEAAILGTKGTIQIPLFATPTELVINGKLVDFSVDRHTNQTMYTMNSGPIFAVEEVRRCLQEGKRESSKLTHGDTLKLTILVSSLKDQVYEK